MGPGSKTMVVSIATGGTSVPFGGWVVFRKAGGTWQLVLQRNDGAEIAAGGRRHQREEVDQPPGRLALLPERRKPITHLAVERNPLHGRCMAADGCRVQE